MNRTTSPSRILVAILSLALATLAACPSATSGPANPGDLAGADAAVDAGPDLPDAGDPGAQPDAAADDAVPVDDVGPSTDAAPGNADPGVIEPLILQTFAIEGGAATTTRRVVVLDATYSGGVPTEAQASGSPDFQGALWRPFTVPFEAQLGAGDGTKTLYFRLRSGERISNALSDTIELAEAATPVVSQTVAPSAEPTTVTWGGWITITVPPGLVATPTELKVVVLPGAPEPPSAGLVLLSAVDITLGDLHELTAPIEIALAYDPLTLNPEYTAEEQLAVGYWDPDNGSWVLIPSAQVDEATATIRFSTRHLSIYGDYALATGWKLSRRPHFRIIYDPGINALFGGIEMFAAKTGGLLEDAWTAYAGFTRPEGRLDVFLEDLGPDTDPSYNGSITINAPTVYSAEGLKFDLGHEYFHAVQHVRYGTLLKMWMVRWWMEATADYASGRISAAVNPVPGTEKLMGENIHADFLTKPLDDDPGIADRHKYYASHFLDFLAKRVDFAGLWADVTDPTKANDPLAHLDAYLLAHTSEDLSSHYTDFAQFFLFDPASPLPYPAGSSLSDLTSYVTKFEEDRTDITGTMSFTGHYSARLWGLPVEIPAGAAARNLIVEPVGSLGDTKVFIDLVVGDVRGGPITRTGPLVEGVKVPVSVYPGTGLYLEAIAGAGGNAVVLKVTDPAPRITSVTPFRIDAYGQFTVTGTRFGDAKGELYMGSAAVGWTNPCEIVSWSDTEIVAKASQIAGPGYVGVRTTEGAYSKNEPMEISDLALLQKMTHHDVRILGRYYYTDTDKGGAFTSDQFPFNTPSRPSYTTISFDGTKLSGTIDQTIGYTHFIDAISGEVDPLGTMLLSFSESFTAVAQSGDSTCLTDSTFQFTLTLSNVPIIRSGSSPADTSFGFLGGRSYGGDVQQMVGTMVDTVKVRQAGTAPDCKYSRDAAYLSADWTLDPLIDGFLGP
jgi:hypothetical protein